MNPVLQIRIICWTRISKTRIQNSLPEPTVNINSEVFIKKGATLLTQVSNGYLFVFFPEGSGGEQATIVDLTEQNQGQDQVTPHRTRPIQQQIVMYTCPSCPLQQIVMNTSPTQQIITYTCPIKQIVPYTRPIQQIVSYTCPIQYNK